MPSVTEKPHLFRGSRPAPGLECVFMVKGPQGIAFTVPLLSFGLATSAVRSVSWTEDLCR